LEFGYTCTGGIESRTNRVRVVIRKTILFEWVDISNDSNNQRAIFFVTFRQEKDMEAGKKTQASRQTSIAASRLPTLVTRFVRRRNNNNFNNNSWPLLSLSPDSNN
jgi:hypothetical protein